MANDTRLRVDFLSGATDTALVAGDVTLSSPQLAGAPVVDATSHLPIVLDPLAVNGAPEVVYLTAHAAAATTATMVRARETTTGGGAARSHPSGTAWVHAPTAADFPAGIVFDEDLFWTGV